MFYYHPLFQNENKKEGFHTHHREREGIVHVHTIASINTFSTHIQSHDTHDEYDQRM